jgi:hypothetical protein
MPARWKMPNETRLAEKIACAKLDSGNVKSAWGMFLKRKRLCVANVANLKTACRPRFQSSSRSAALVFALTM